MRAEPKSTRSLSIGALLSHTASHLQEAQPIRAFAPSVLSAFEPCAHHVAFALSGSGETVTARPTKEGGLTVRGSDVDGMHSVVLLVAQAVLASAGMESSFELELTPQTAGLGLSCSAASASAAALAVNQLLGAPLRKRELVRACLESGAALNAAEVTASMMGGLICVHATSPLSWIRLPVPEGLSVACSQVLETSAGEQRGEPGPNVSGKMAAFVSACYSADFALLGLSMEPDDLATLPQPLARARGMGALGVSVRERSYFALCVSERSALEIAAAMGGGRGESVLLVSPADCPGGRIV